MDEAMRKVLDLFAELNRDSLDLHNLFEAGGNDPAARHEVLDVVNRLVSEGYLEGQGSDFYALTKKGRRVIKPA